MFILSCIFCGHLLKYFALSITSFQQIHVIPASICEPIHELHHVVPDCLVIRLLPSVLNGMVWCSIGLFPYQDGKTMCSHKYCLFIMILAFPDFLTLS